MALDRGTIHARIWAPPKLFFVDTQAAVAVDLGCAYTLQVDEKGDGLLRVTSGWVGLEREGRDTYIPEGAVCATRSEHRPGHAALRRCAVRLRRGADGPRLRPRRRPTPRGGARARPLDGAASRCDDVVAPADPRVARRAGTGLRSAGRPGAAARRRHARRRSSRAIALALNQWWDRSASTSTTWWRLFKKKW